MLTTSIMPPLIGRILCWWLLLLLLHLPTLPQSQAVDTVVVGLDGEQQQADKDEPDEQSSNNPLACHAWTGASCDWEPNLKQMTVVLGPHRNETFYAYVTPDVSTSMPKPVLP